MTYYEAFEQFILALHSILGKTIVHYCDVFIIVLTLALKARFQQINEGILAAENEDKPIKFWRQVREDYNRLAYLVQRLDEDLSFMMLSAVGFNCFWIIKLLFNTLTVGLINQRLNFLYSFGFLLFRFFLVFESCVQLNVESKNLSFIIQTSNIPSYNIEISRLLLEIQLDRVFFSGCKLFKMKKGVILSIAGVIVTYELTIYQYQAFRGT